MRSHIATILSAVLLMTASTGTASAQPASGVQDGRGARARCDDQWRSADAAERERLGGYNRFLDTCLARCPRARADETQTVFEGRLQHMCELRWKTKLESGNPNHETYEDFMGRCARSCPPVAYGPTGLDGREIAAGALLAAGGLAIGLAATSGGSSDKPTSP